MDLAIFSNKTLIAGMPLYFVEVVKYAMECWWSCVKVLY